MRIRAGALILATLAFGLSALGARLWRNASEAKLEERLARLEEQARRQDLEHEVEQRRAKIEAEIARLGPDHAWAGRYYAGDGLGSNRTIWVAPESGCLAVSSGCLGIYGANWGKVEAQGARLRLVFERAQTGDEFASFDSEYEVERAGDSRVLNPLSTREPLSLQR